MALRCLLRGSVPQHYFSHNTKCLFSAASSSTNEGNKRMKSNVSGPGENDIEQNFPNVDISFNAFTMDRMYERVRSQNFDPVPVQEKDLKNLHKSSFEYEKYKHLNYNGIPYEKLPVIKILARWNNTIMSVRTADMKHYCCVSCRTAGFFNANKKTELAGEVTGQTCARKAFERGCTDHVRVIVKGIGPGRKPSIKGLIDGGMTVVSVTDITPITNEHLPQRPRKIRRI